MSGCTGCLDTKHGIKGLSMYNKFRCHTTPIQFLKAFHSILRACRETIAEERWPSSGPDWKGSSPPYRFFDLWPDHEELDDGTILIMFTGHYAREPTNDFINRNGELVFGETGWRQIVIQFDVRPVSDSVIFVIGGCDDSSFFEEYQSLLHIINDLYPESELRDREQSSLSFLEKSPVRYSTVRQSRGGRPQMKAHKNAITRLQDRESRKVNFYKWKREYQEESGTDPDDMQSGASELYRQMVWRKWRKQIGEN
jgi:hypothetical protein